ncbi:MAG: alpha-ketoglutarate-dependent dioxygenase AlkB [Bacteroidia bacterium]
MKHLQIIPGMLKYFPNMFGEQESVVLFKNLQHTLLWQEKSIIIFGREVMQPRLVAWYGDEGIAYTYSGKTLTALPWTAELMQIKDRVEAVSGETFNSVLCNYYRYGQDSMGWHSDDEKELGEEPVIASVSFGAERKFVLKEKNGSDKTELMLENGTLLLMYGKCQQHYKHALPKSMRVSQGRINLTFRRVKC